MPKPPRYLKQLEYELLALGDDAMLLEELDGFIAGLLVCPELIKPSEWLPVVWGSEGEDDPAFDSLDHLNRVLGLVMEHTTMSRGHDRATRSLRPAVRRRQAAKRDPLGDLGCWLR